MWNSDLREFRAADHVAWQSKPKTEISSVEEWTTIIGLID